MQVTLASPEITCAHCIATIRGVAERTEGVRFVAGDDRSKTFVVEIESGAALDRLGAALAAEGYPLGDLPGAAPHPGAERTEGWRPASYRIERTAVGANVNYDCYCGCDAGFALDRSAASPATESCCCGNVILVGADASARIAAHLPEPSRFLVDVQTVTMPWGQPMEVALAIPTDE